MVIKKNTNISYIYNGKQEYANIRFDKYLDGYIPIYLCNSINNIRVIKLSDNSVFIIVGSTIEYNESELSISIWKHILKLCKAYNDNIIYTMCSIWYGFIKTIDYINKYDESNIDSIRTLERIIKLNKNIQIPSKESIISDISFVEVN